MAALDWDVDYGSRVVTKARYNGIEYINVCMTAWRGILLFVKARK